jgi:hypothetical protein
MFATAFEEAIQRQQRDSVQELQQQHQRERLAKAERQ